MQIIAYLSTKLIPKSSRHLLRRIRITVIVKKLPVLHKELAVKLTRAQLFLAYLNAGRFGLSRPGLAT